MSFQQKLRQELKAVGLTTLYFAAWLGMLMVLKVLLLAEYQIQFRGLSQVLIGALILAKVVLVFEHVPLGAWIRNQPVVFRTALYAFGVFVVMVLEKAFEGRHEHGGFSPALIQLFQHPEMHHVGVVTICLTGALLGFNVGSALRQQIGDHELNRLFLLPPPRDAARDSASDQRGQCK